MGMHYFSYFCSKTKVVSTLVDAVLMSTHIVCFEQKYEKYHNSLSEMFLLFGRKIFSVLNRHVFVIASAKI